MISEKKKEKLLKNLEEGKIIDESSLATFELISDMEDKIDELEVKVEKAVEDVKKSKLDLPKVLESVRGKDGEDGSQGIQGEKGNDYILTEKDKKEIASKIEVPVVEKVIERTEVIREKPIVTNEVKEVAVADTAEQVRDKLESLDGENRLRIEAINGLQEILNKLKKKTGTTIFGGGFNYSAMDFHIIDDETPSGTVNGTNTDFTIKNAPSPTTSLKVYVNGQRMRITTDYTFSGTTVTFLTAPPTESIILCDYRI